jgi:hypothetical protein
VGALVGIVGAVVGFVGADVVIGEVGEFVSVPCKHPQSKPDATTQLPVLPFVPIHVLVEEGALPLLPNNVEIDCVHIPQLSVVDSVPRGAPHCVQ